MKPERRNDPGSSTGPGARAKWVLVAFLAIAGYLLVTEHKAHLSGGLSQYWIWLLLLACPVMHLFMHGGHGHGGRGNDRHHEHGDKRE